MLEDTPEPANRAALDSLGARADRLAQDLPSELPAWMKTLGPDSVRTLSVGLLLDLLALEKDPERASDIARDMEALAEDLRLAGAGGDAKTVTEALTKRAGKPGATSLVRDPTPPLPLANRVVTRRRPHVTVGRIVFEETEGGPTGMAAARQIYSTAVATAETLWSAAQAGDQPDPGAARKIIDSLAELVTGDRTSLVALTALKQYDNYTFTHMVNVSVLAMAQARALNVEGPLLREFGLAALMHDIGKVNTPLEVLNKPDKLTRDEFDIMKQHVVDGAHILRRTPEMPALAPIVAFEHHLKQDLSGYPENIGSRTLNLCTMVVSIADVFDALRSNRPYRQGLATSRIRAIMGEQGNPAFNQALLKRFVNLMGLFPVGTLVRLITDELAVVTAEHPSDPLRPQVKVIANPAGDMLETPLLVSTWAHDGRGEHPRAVVEALDPEPLGLDPLKYL
jgi:putative nucleotidyltransferase with HDIG domain